jgi:GH25 family lysozyme M1 (1,4-beta-N-acetylmuramidase)
MFAVDVSGWNHVTSWQDAQAAGVALGISKATEGLSFVDPSYQDNWLGSNVCGARASYHFGHPKNDPIQEAGHYLSVASFGIHDYPMLDLETTDGLGFAHAADWGAAFCGEVKARTGKAPLFYSYLSFIGSMGAKANQLVPYPLFIAAYQATAPSPSPWPKWTIWQDTSTGHVPGISGNVDMDELAPGALSLFAPAYSAQGGHVNLNKPISAFALTPSGKGYWMVGEDGGVFAEGDATDHGSLPGLHVVPSAPVIGIAAMHDGGGYWLVGSDGGIFCFGNAKMFGSMGGHHLNAPIVGMAASPDGQGYGLVGADGGIFPFGDFAFEGSIA